MTDKYEYLKVMSQYHDMNDLVRRGNITLIQYHILLSIYKFNCDTPSKMSDFLPNSPSSISRSMNALQSSDLIIKKYGNDDQRTTHVEITDTGKKLVDQLHKEIKKYYSDVL